MYCTPCTYYPSQYPGYTVHPVHIIHINLLDVQDTLYILSISITWTPCTPYHVHIIHLNILDILDTLYILFISISRIHCTPCTYYPGIVYYHLFKPQTNQTINLFLKQGFHTRLTIHTTWNHWGFFLGVALCFTIY